MNKIFNVILLILCGISFSNQAKGNFVYFFWFENLKNKNFFYLID